MILSTEKICYVFICVSVREAKGEVTSGTGRKESEEADEEII